jgi:hypothetical protein
MNTSEVLNQAADVLQVRGWCQAPAEGGWFPDPEATTPVCLEGAIRIAAGTVRKQEVTAVVRDYLTSRHPESINPFSGHVIPFAWNDEDGRTAAEVIEVLRACALIEAAREQDAVWSTYAEVVTA